MGVAVNSLFSTRYMAVVGAVAAALIMWSSNAVIWIPCILALPLAIWLVGSKDVPVVLWWIIAFFWIEIAGDLVAADFSGQAIKELDFGEYRARAIYYCLGAMLALAYGMGVGRSLGVRQMGHPEKIAVPAAWNFDGGVALNPALVCYVASLISGVILDQLAYAIPGLTQPLLALTLLKFVCIYLIAAKVFKTNRGHLWLLAIAVLEIAVGMVSFFASYKEPVFVILMALVASRRRISVGYIIAGLAAVFVVIWISLVWTVIKSEFRLSMFSMTTGEQVAWLENHYLASDIDYADAFSRLAQRVGYTTFLAQTMDLEAAGPLPRGFNYYEGAIKHVLTPRLFFPDKAALSDSASTIALLGIVIWGDTSVGVGFVTQAYVDFGFPGLLVPIWIIGVLLGLAAHYFMTRPVPTAIRRAFATATLFLLFPLEGNIDKEFGAFVIDVVVMGFVVKFGYPMIASWLAGSPPGIAGRGTLANEPSL
ncbi:MAG: hypothetical protein ABSD21_08205 [Rhizomicrobium sp.]